MIIRYNSVFSLDLPAAAPPTSDIKYSTRTTKHSTSLKNSKIYESTQRSQRSHISRQSNSSTDRPPMKRFNRSSVTLNASQPNNLHTVTNLVQLIDDRRKTFVRFGFKAVELDEERNLWPFIKDFMGKDQKGSMLVNELWSEGNLTKFVRLANFDGAKRIVKRLANTSKMERQNFGQKIFTNKEELELKLKMQTQSPDKVHEDIQKKFAHRATIIKLAEKKIQLDQLNLQPEQLEKKFKRITINLPNTDLDRSQVKNLPDVPCKVQVDNLIGTIDQTIEGSAPDKKRLDRLLHKLQDKIVERRVKAAQNQLRAKHN